MIETILNRRSVRRFTDQDVEEEKLDLILRAAMQAPSAKNEQPWEFLVIRDKAMLERLAKVQPYAGAMRNAPCGIITLYNRALCSDDIDAFWRENLSSTTETILLAAASLGLGATWLALAPLQERIDAVREIFDLPEGVVPFAMIPIGYPLKKKEADPRYRPERVFYEQYASPDGAGLRPRLS